MSMVLSLQVQVVQILRCLDGTLTKLVRVGSAEYFGGYIAEFHLVDGTALDPTDFGESDNNGVWRPKRYTGSYGTNGFYLKFESSGVGTDSSGSGNNFTPTGFSTSGTGTDVMSDTPTTNYATLNPISSNASLSLSNGNLDTPSTQDNKANNGTIGVSLGKWYWEVTVNSNFKTLSLYWCNFLILRKTIQMYLRRLEAEHVALYALTILSSTRTTLQAHTRLEEQTKGQPEQSELPLILTQVKLNTTEITLFSILIQLFRQMEQRFSPT
jgi:hypothetical protein